MSKQPKYRRLTPLRALTTLLRLEFEAGQNSGRDSFKMGSSEARDALREHVAAALVSKRRGAR